MLTAARLRLPVHHITVQNLDGQLAVSFDVEVDGAMTLARAHEVADRLEAAIQEELGPQVEVESHIEPLAHRPSRRPRGGRGDGRPDRVDARREHRRGRDPGGAQRPGSETPGTASS